MLWLQNDNQSKYVIMLSLTLGRINILFFHLLSTEYLLNYIADIFLGTDEIVINEIITTFFFMEFKV